MKQARVSLGIILVLGLSLIIGCLYQQPRALRAKLTVRFVTFTNDVSGGSLATFSLLNTGNSPVLVILPGVIELRNTPLNNPGRIVHPTTLSPSDQPLTTMVVSPVTQDQWRVGFSYWKVRDKYSRLFHRLISRLAAPLGIKIPSDTSDFSTAHSEWMAPPTEPDWMGFD